MFSGKKINRPVANYDYCHNVFNGYIAKILNETNVAEKNEDAVAIAMLQVRRNNFKGDFFPSPPFLPLFLLLVLQLHFRMQTGVQ